MTVASLWKMLDTAGSGKRIGASELVNGTIPSSSSLSSFDDALRQNSYGTADFRQQQQDHQQQLSNRPTLISSIQKRSTLAVDLSIWICESLTSHAIGDNHANPALHLVFSRTIKLLSLGIKLVFVVEGKRRIRGDAGQDDTFRKRRSGTAFWKACQDCQRMLQLLGVPVVRAKAEGEALCALLSQRGVVDGVISNDGDCLLFGAKTVYTKFSIENLENSNVVRYDLDDLRAVAETSTINNNNTKNDGDSEDAKENGEEANNGADQMLSLSRHDLIAFALLTGSDLAGNGLSKVGYKKAVRFIRKCQMDNPISKETATITELKSWARAAAVGGQRPPVGNDNVPEACDDDANDNKKKTEKCCSRCSHHGSKRNHAKHGCEQCGTEPGEPCYELSSDDKFRKSLRAKALEVHPPFEPSQVLEAYLRPNDNQMPIQFASITSSYSVAMAPPRLRELLSMPLIIKGRAFDTSRSYVQQMVGRLLARNELFRTTDNINNNGTNNADADPRQRLSRECPVPKRITRALVQNQIPSYEVSWLVNATLTNENGDGIDGYEYSTIEPQELVDKSYPSLVQSFQLLEKEKKKQGDGEQVRRREFLEILFGGDGMDDHEEDDDEERQADLGFDGDVENRMPRKPNKEVKKREEFFQKQVNKRSQRLDKPRKEHKDRRRTQQHKRSDDVAVLLGNQQHIKGWPERTVPSSDPMPQIPKEIVVRKAVPKIQQEREEPLEERPRPVLFERTNRYPIAGDIPEEVAIWKKKSKKEEVVDKKKKRSKKSKKRGAAEYRNSHADIENVEPPLAMMAMPSIPRAFDNDDVCDNRSVDSCDRSAIFCHMGDLMVEISPLVVSKPKNRRGELSHPPGKIHFRRSHYHGY